ncbi:hypothetical protein ACPPVV_01170 [Rhodanobacter sp. Col0626]|uniref:hypothetical protein n=1 Tax=Rhodanobacter sp. Col0626 TaxID=3415679 RepID=UPI003CF8F222
MKSKKITQKLLKEVGLAYSNAPRTHFFYEYQGERAIDALLMIENGINLWHEQMLNIPERDVSHLWAYAAELLASRRDTLMYSHVEWLRYQITMGIIVPEKWDRRRPYPYKWMLISAVYFQEARRLCEEGGTDRAWHVVTMAYYQLGMNTNPSLTQAVAKAAKARHSEASMSKRAFVLAALDQVKRAGSAKSIPDAIEKVYDLIAGSKTATQTLDEIEGLTPEAAEHAEADDAVERLRGTLKSWARPDGPYPEMSDAFSYFDSEKTQPSTFRPTDEGIPSERLPDECTHYMRTVSYMNNGDVLTAEISRDASEEAHEESKR